jgi:chromosome segregation ATPase
MKKIVILSLLTGLLLSSCNYESPKYRALKASRDSLQNVLVQKDKEANEYLSIIDEIEQNLEQIKAVQGFITADQGEGTLDARTRIQNNMNLINNLLNENKAKIADLEQKAKQVGALQARVNSLRKQMEEKEAEIASLRKELAEKDSKIKQLDSTVISLNEDVTVLSAEKKIIENIAVEQDAALHTAYYFFGTTKELKNKGIDVKKRTLNKAAFTKVDTRDITSIKLNSKSGIVLTNHPIRSYKIHVIDKKATLEIINPTEFWSMSKYLVVKVK